MKRQIPPVLGVILMVAITIIIAAVVAIFVFSMEPETQSLEATQVSPEDAFIIDNTVTINHVTDIKIATGENRYVTIYKAYNPEDNTTIYISRWNDEIIQIIPGKV